MTKKVDFDNYMKMQVDLMRSSVYSSTPCNFLYDGYLGSEQIDTKGFNIKQQWAVQMVMSRLNICSIYHAAAYSSLEFIFQETINSFKKDYKNSTKFVNNLQIAFKYFNEGYQPLKRMVEVYDTFRELFKNGNDIESKVTEVKK